MNECVQATCDTTGCCGTQDVAMGTKTSMQTPGSCHSNVCDGMGTVTSVVDMTNTPTDIDACHVGGCDMSGAPVQTPRPAGTPCTSGNGELCDGVGRQCVRCLTSADCAMNQTCNTGVCVSACTTTLGLPGPPLVSAGTAPESVAVADLNGDGKPDLAAANWPARRERAARTTATARSPPRSTTPRAGPHPVAAADLNGDGKPDLAVVNVDGDTVSVLLNNGDGTFAAKVDYPTGAGPESVAAADLNGDGKPDLAVANDGDDTVSVLLNDGDGTFAAKVDYPAGTRPRLGRGRRT